MRKLLTFLLVAVMLAMLTEEAGGRSVKAYFNEQEATVTNVTLRQGEPFTIDLKVTPDGEADAWAEIVEPGDPRTYDRLGGDDLVPAAFKRCNASSEARFHWDMAANGNWAGGTAPLNVYYQINGRDSNDVIVQGYFTVVEAYISTQAPAADAAGSADKKAEKTPSPDVILTVICILAVCVQPVVSTLKH